MTTAAARAEDRTEDRTEDRAAIATLLADAYAAWTDNDAERFVEHYADDATAILPGSLRAGREAIRDAMAAGFAGRLRGTSTVDDLLALRFVGEDTAVATSRSGILFPGETEVPEDRLVHATWVFARREGRWVVEAYHNSPVRVPTPA